MGTLPTEKVEAIAAMTSDLDADDWAQIKVLLPRSTAKTTYFQQAYLKASNTGRCDNFSDAVSVDGDTFVVGAHGEDSYSTGVNGNQADNSANASGAGYVFSVTTSYSLFLPLILQ